MFRAQKGIIERAIFARWIFQSLIPYRNASGKNDYDNLFIYVDLLLLKFIQYYDCAIVLSTSLRAGTGKLQFSIQSTH